MKKLGVGLLTVVTLLTLTGVALANDPVTITTWDFKYGDMRWTG